jgi:glycerate kinase
MDSFKSSATAVEACEAARRGLESALPGAEVSLVPMADGGEGTASTLANAQGGEWIEAEVAGPLPGMRVQASWLWLPRGGPGALVEMASAS